MRWKQPGKYGVRACAELANIFLKQLKQLPVIEQMQHQNIVQIVKRPLLCYGALVLTDCKTGLVIFLSHEFEMEQWLKTMGHEIGHSFFYKKIGTRIVRTCRRSYAEENFCEIFSEKWLSSNNNAHETEALLAENILNPERWSYIKL